MPKKLSVAAINAMKRLIYRYLLQVLYSSLILLGDWSDHQLDLNNPLEFINCKHVIAVLAEIYLKYETISISLDRIDFIYLYINYLSSKLVVPSVHAKAGTWYLNIFNLRYYENQLFNNYYPLLQGTLQLYYTDVHDLVFVCKIGSDESLNYHCFECPKRRSCFHRAKLPVPDTITDKPSRVRRHTISTDHTKYNIRINSMRRYSMQADQNIMKHMFTRMNAGIVTWIEAFAPDGVFKSEITNCFRPECEHKQTDFIPSKMSHTETRIFPVSGSPQNVKVIVDFCVFHIL